MKHVDLTSGIGGFALAARWVGWETVGFCEIDPFCRKVLAKNFPGVPVWDDLQTLEVEIVRQWIASARGVVLADTEHAGLHGAEGRFGSGMEQRKGWTQESQGIEQLARSGDRFNLPKHDDLKTLTTEHVRGWLVGVQPCLDSDEQGEPVGPRHGASQPAKLGPYVLTAGYPCQPFSHAGKRAGEDDPRHLWPWIHRLLAGLSDDKPDWVVFENVRGHVSMGLDGVLDDLEGLGYATRTFVVPAAGVGALHRRDRVWIVGCRDVADSGGAGGGSKSGSAGGRGRESSDAFQAAAVRPGNGPDGAARADTGRGDCGSDVADAASGEAGRGRRGEVDGATRPGGRVDSSAGAGGQDVADPTGIGAGGSDHKEDAFARGRETRAVSERGSSRGRPGSRVLPAGAETQPGFCGTADGIPAGVDDPLACFGRGWEYGVPLTVSGSVPDRVHRLKALGNAIVPQVAYVIFQAINEAELTQEEDVV